jgi:hypothetical protein
MSRPGRFSLRVLAVTGVLFAWIAPASFGAAASLSNEFFESTPALGQQTTFGAYTCNKSGTTVVPFQTQGTAIGPYAGTFTETGTITIGPQTDTTLDTRGVGAILNFQASFTISSQTPAGTVTGTKQLAPTAPTAPSLSAFGRCDPNGSSPPATDLFAIVTDPFVVYNAQINATTGNRTDSGTSSFVIRSMTDPGAPASFQEAFNSTGPACEDGNNGNGNGQGHQKPKNDNDDEEVCP